MVARNGFFFFFSSRRRHTRLQGDWSSDVCSSDLLARLAVAPRAAVSTWARTRVSVGAAVTEAERILPGCLPSAAVRETATEREMAVALPSVAPVDTAALRAVTMLRDTPVAVVAVALRVFDMARARVGDAVMLAPKTLPARPTLLSVGLAVSPALRLRW